MGDTVITDQDMSDDERRAVKWPDSADKVNRPEPGKAAGAEDQPAGTAKAPDHGQREADAPPVEGSQAGRGGAASRARSNPRA